MEKTEIILREWETIGISDNFIFGKVMRDKRLCKKLIELILGIKVNRIEFPDVEKTLEITDDSRGIRMDVYVEGEGEGGAETVYNIEMQTVNKDVIPKRSRYYQGMIDLGLIERGELYGKLKKSYVIFICTFDLFHKGRHKYSFQNRCDEDNGITLGDETYKIFLNTKGTMDDVDQKLKAFLDYVSGLSTNDDFVKELQDRVAKIKLNTEWRREYMTLRLRDIEMKEEGRAEGRAEGVRDMILRLLSQYKDVEKTAAALLTPVEEIRKIAEENNISL